MNVAATEMMPLLESSASAVTASVSVACIAWGACGYPIPSPLHLGNRFAWNCTMLILILLCYYICHFFLFFPSPSRLELM